MAALQRPGFIGSGEGDIYTVLMIIATVFGAIATIVLAYQFGSYYGFDNLIYGPAGIPK